MKIVFQRYVFIVPLDTVVNNNSMPRLMIQYVLFILQVKEAYINFLNHCYIDTEVEMKEIYTSHHMWSLFEKSFPIDLATVANHTADRKHADRALESYVCNSVMNVITTFFNSPFSDQCTTVQVC